MQSNRKIWATEPCLRALCLQGNELEAEVASLSAESGCQTLPISSFVFSEDAFVISFSSGDEVIDDAREFMRRGGDGLGGAQSGAQATVILPQVRLTVAARIERPSVKPKRCGS